MLLRLCREDTDSLGLAGLLFARLSAALPRQTSSFTDITQLLDDRQSSAFSSKLNSVMSESRRPDDLRSLVPDSG